MEMIINDDCINCGACAVECPTEAIYAPGESREENGKLLIQVSDEHFFIEVRKCDECSGLEIIKCITVCPMDAIKKM